MTPNEYQQQSNRTCLPDYEKFRTTLSPFQQHILHAHMGISSEAGEVGDCIKKHFIYGQPLDTVNLVEECGDLLWYISLMLSACGSNIEQAMQENLAKLKLRYPEKFTKELAKQRLDKVESKVNNINICPRCGAILSKSLECYKCNFKGQWTPTQ
jgi:NTP pyrophosphatase (non-canonical NTP hydrolase)/ribosomal protein L40E